MAQYLSVGSDYAFMMRLKDIMCNRQSNIFPLIETPAK